MLLSTAVEIGVISYDGSTGVLKCGRTEPMFGFNTDGSDNTSPQYGFEEFRFTSSVATGGSLTINGGSVALDIQDDFQNITTVLNNRTYYLGQNFINGVSLPEVKKYSGNIVPMLTIDHQLRDLHLKGRHKDHLRNSNKKSCHRKLISMLSLL